MLPLIYILQKQDLHWSPLICQARNGICSLCYGLNLGPNQMANLVDSVGILAVQSISEPGTQLILRTFHGLENVDSPKMENPSQHCSLPCSY